MKRYREFVWLVLFGSLWGINEAVIGGALFKEDVPYSSVWLSAWAFLLLALARGVMDKPGTSTAVGAIAASFKLIHAAPFFCHCLGIFALGMSFDIVTTLLIKPKGKISYRNSLSGAVSAYIGYALFALTMTYIVRYEFWVAGGSGKALHHIFVTGSFAALAALVTVPIGYWIGDKGKIFTHHRPSWAFNGALIASLALWALGRIAG